MKNVAEERRKRQPVGVDSGFRQEDVTVNPRPLASDEPTLSLAHGLCEHAFLPVCPFRAVLHVSVRVVRGQPRKRGPRKKYTTYTCVCMSAREQPRRPSYQTLSSNYYHANRYVRMHARMYIACIVAATTWTAFQSVDWLRSLAPCFSSGSSDSQWGAQWPRGRGNLDTNRLRHRSRRGRVTIRKLGRSSLMDF